MIKNRNPSEPRSVDQVISRVVSSFQGMITGEPPNKIGNQFATLNYNLIDMGQYSKVRPGSKKYTTAALPETYHEYSIDSTAIAANLYWGYIDFGVVLAEGTMVWLVGKDFPSPLKQNTPYFVSSDWDLFGFPPPVGKPTAMFLLSEPLSEKLIFITSLGTDDNWNLVTGGVMGFCDHTKKGKLIWHMGEKVYISDKAVSSFTQVTNLSSNKHRNDSMIIPFDDYAIICSSSGGMSRIVLDSSPFMYKINIDPPDSLITEVNETLTPTILSYGYLYLYSFSRITKSSGTLLANEDRVSDGVLLEFETGTCLKPNTEKDYSEVFFATAIGASLAVDHIIGDFHALPDTSINRISLYRTKNIGENSPGGASPTAQGIGNRRDQFVWVKDIPMAKTGKLVLSPNDLTVANMLYNASWDSGDKIVLGDIGSTFAITGGPSISGTVKILTYIDNSNVVITNLTSGVTQCGYTMTIGADTFYIEIYWDGTRWIAKLNGFPNFRYFSVADEGLTGIAVVAVIRGNNMKVKSYTSPTVCVLEFSSFYQGPYIGNSQYMPNGTYDHALAIRKWNDVVPDQPTIDGRVSLQDRILYGTDLYIPRRFFTGMPNGNIAYQADGFLVTADRDSSIYSYCQTGDKKYCIGQYKYPDQSRPVDGAIRHIVGMPYKAIVLMSNKTGILTLSSSQNVGRTEIGENIFQIAELSISDTVRGVYLWKMIAYKNTNLLFAITNEGALRYFDGNAWSMQDYAYQNGLDAVSKEYLKKIDQSQTIHMVYSTGGGLKLWFKISLQIANTILPIPYSLEKCLRMATEPNEGIGWGEIGGDEWVRPAERLGVFTILDDNGIQRILVVDSDGYIYEIDTIDRITSRLPFALDKIGVAASGVGAEIPWKKRWREEVIAIGDQHDSLVDEASHVYIQPDASSNRAAAGYTATGQRNAQELTLRTYLDGEKTNYAAESHDFPENGEIVFSGRDVEASRIMKELEGTASEILITGMVNEFLGRKKAPSVSLRTMTEHTLQKELSTGLVVHICRQEKLINRVTGVDLGALAGRAGPDIYPGIVFPDGRESSGIWTDNTVNLDNSALSTYTIIYTGFDLTNYFPDVGAFTQYGETISGTPMRFFCYKKGSNLPARTRIGNGYKFDVRVYNKNISIEAIALLYYDIVKFHGRMLLPGFK